MRPLPHYIITAGHASGFLHYSGELEASDLALYLLSDNPRCSHSVNNTEVNRGVQDPPGKTHSLWSLFLYSVLNFHSTSEEEACPAPKKHTYVYTI